MSSAVQPSPSLADTLLFGGMPEPLIRDRLLEIHTSALQVSKHLREPNFRSIHTNDLKFLFDAYDSAFFGSTASAALEGRSLTFRLSRRMTRSGGTTTRTKRRTGEESFEIAIAAHLLFEGFEGGERDVTACGILCTDRLQALQRIFEHELIHLAEFLAWGNSRCSAPRFQALARRFFLHDAHTHQLMTRGERAASVGVGVGSWVAFSFEGREYSGRVNRITKRATVLVADPEGRRFSDGHKYACYYIPLQSLRPAAKAASA